MNTNRKKWYWGYINNQGQTCIFNCIDRARAHATRYGMFDDICGKDAMMDFDENLFFEISENELKDHRSYSYN